MPGSFTWFLKHYPTSHCLPNLILQSHFSLLFYTNFLLEQKILCPLNSLGPFFCPFVCSYSEGSGLEFPKDRGACQKFLISHLTNIHSLLASTSHLSGCFAASNRNRLQLIQEEQEFFERTLSSSKNFYGTRRMGFKVDRTARSSVITPEQSHSVQASQLSHATPTPKHCSFLRLAWIGTQMLMLGLLTLLRLGSGCGCPVSYCQREFWVFSFSNHPLIESIWLVF